MRKRSVLTAVAIVATMSSPAWALICDGGTTGSGLSGKWSIGGSMRQDDQNSFDLMRLRQEGVDATSVERWNGCIRAFVRKPEGGESMQYFDPRTFQRVQ